MNPRAMIAVHAESQLGVREVSENRSPLIEKYWTATSYPDGMENREPWCAAFVAWCVMRARRDDPLLRVGKRPDFASVAAWRAWASQASSGVDLWTPGARLEQRGDIALFTFSHIGIVLENAGNYVLTVEGNTNLAGEREGGSVMRKVRQIHTVEWFLRLPCLPAK